MSFHKNREGQTKALRPLGTQTAPVWLWRGLMLGSLCLALAACDPAPRTIDTPSRGDASGSVTPLPRMNHFDSKPAPLPDRSNADMARDFLDLHFALEGGSRLPVLTRFEGPINVTVTGQPTATLNRDLQALLTRLRREAGIPLRQVSAGTPAQITIEAVTRAQIQRTLPQAACFVVPNVSSLDEYRRKRNQLSTSWADLRRRERLAIFVPNDVSPQELRDCLHEELAQALGPLNDLYRLPDSVFNDDNVHTVLTGFDMLMLRATYAPDLRTGMTREQVAARIPAILNRLNPRGERRASDPLPSTPRRWSAAVEAALGSSNSGLAPQVAAARAAAIARDLGWVDHRRAFSHFLVGRAKQPADRRLALAHFQTAENYLPSPTLHAPLRALVATRIAALHLSLGEPAQALAKTGPAMETARATENAALLATLMLLRAEALDQMSRPTEANALRRESLGWARYGLGPDWAIRARERDIAALSP
ncbi:hypothetical protein TRM7557_03024 [Tritonibacter multivorans]|uniref:ATP-dependent transcriptional regulator n=2 Tax=Tritonibacter multivorans TaxID=928856 RepID=A0A0P1GFS5_9RHOB|nr:hypothetical protein TRM7557_03024 [Tritonibacter multivorans]SFC84889.1 Protein of unknown function [Tritonibacter multivorans]